MTSHIKHFRSIEDAEEYFGGQIGDPIFAVIDQYSLLETPEVVESEEDQQKRDPDMPRTGLSDSERAQLEQIHESYENRIYGGYLLEMVIASAVKTASREPLSIGDNYYAYPPLNAGDRIGVQSGVMSTIKKCNENEVMSESGLIQNMPILIEVR